jgi:hypothetical protein
MAIAEPTIDGQTRNAATAAGEQAAAKPKKTTTRSKAQFINGFNASHACRIVGEQVYFCISKCWL